MDISISMQQLHQDYWDYFDLPQERVRELILGEDLMECENAFMNIQSAIAPSIRYKRRDPEGGYYEGYASRTKRSFWQIGSGELSPEIERELEWLWGRYHYFKNDYMRNEQNEIIGSPDTNKYIHLRNLLQAQLKHGWIFDCQFTMFNLYNPESQW